MVMSIDADYPLDELVDLEECGEVVVNKFWALPNGRRRPDQRPFRRLMCLSYRQDDIKHRRQLSKKAQELVVESGV